MSWAIGKEFKFDAAHRLDGLPDDHPCSRLHGHTYNVTLHLEGDTLDATGFVVDYGELSEFKRWVDDTLDHRYLNDVLPIQPSAELLAAHLYSEWHPRIPWLAGVTVKETASTYATYRPFRA